MFFRLKKTATGRALQLVESFRNTEGSPRQRIVVSLGDMEIPREHWKETARAVEEALYRGEQPQLFASERPAEAEQWADQIVKRVEREGKWKPVKRASRRRKDVAERGVDEGAGGAEPAQEKKVVDGVVASEVGHTHTTGLGPVLVGLHAWNRLGMPELLADLGFSEQRRRTAAALVLNRLDDPVSEHAMPAWIANGSLPDLLGGELRARGDDAFYRVGDALLEHRDRIESHLRRRQAGLFHLNRTLLLYDLTNTHFEGVCAANPKAKASTPPWTGPSRPPRTPSAGSVRRVSPCAGTSSPPFKKASSVKTSSTALTSSSSARRRCASEGKTSFCWRSTSFASSAQA